MIPRLRTLAPALLLTVALGTEDARANLRRLEMVAIWQSSLVLDHGSVRVVFHAPPGLLWIRRPVRNSG